ncbi:MAG: hypothetical protein ACTSP9_01545 [Promethearchaeota archaeon]
MSNCRDCGQEIIQEHLEGEIEICTSCIMINSRIYSIKLASLSCLIVITSIVFVIYLIQIIINIPTFNFEENVIFFSISLTVCIITGGSLFVMLLYYKKINI